ncbi:Fic/DOC family protein [Sporosarcina limicola]|uniref:protein adenylyltransferase n=1 Tax=Sporosarcina limicola TaxID=34101 RepID=A0A927MM06_9BACL|nr:Fic family protein [Sporosarcina limicola]MBE1556446.1 cell filamentation protein [Sporosarcina limicola]
MSKYNTEDQGDYLLKHNLFGATSHEQLEQLETVAFSIRSSQLEVDGFEWLLPLKTKTIKQLHFFLFQDVYPFAGQIRDVQLMKGHTRFCQAEDIESNLKALTEQLQKEQRWESIEQAAERLTYYKTELNIIHLFREGNGRTLRIVIREVARSHGFDWNFQNIDPRIYMQAMIQSVTDESLLKKLLEDTLNPH